MLTRNDLIEAVQALDFADTLQSEKVVDAILRTIIEKTESPFTVDELVRLVEPGA